MKKYRAAKILPHVNEIAAELVNGKIFFWGKYYLMKEYRTAKILPRVNEIAAELVIGKIFQHEYTNGKIFNHVILFFFIQEWRNLY